MINWWLIDDWLVDDWLMITWWFIDHWLMIDWSLIDDWLMTDWWWDGLITVLTVSCLGLIPEQTSKVPQGIYREYFSRVSSGSGSGSKNMCARTDTVFFIISEVSKGTVSLRHLQEYLFGIPFFVNVSENLINLYCNISLSCAQPCATCILNIALPTRDGYNK